MTHIVSRVAFFRASFKCYSFITRIPENRNLVFKAWISDEDISSTDFVIFFLNCKEETLWTACVICVFVQITAPQNL